MDTYKYIILLDATTSELFVSNKEVMGGIICVCLLRGCHHLLCVSCEKQKRFNTPKRTLCTIAGAKWYMREPDLRTHHIEVCLMAVD